MSSIVGASRLRRGRDRKSDEPDGLPTLREIKTTTAKRNVVASVKAKVLSIGARVSAATAVPTVAFAAAA